MIDENVISFLIELKSRGGQPIKLAVHKSASNKICIWAEIANNDEATEHAIYLSEAKINADFESIGFSIDTTIVEESDNLEVPDGYTTIFPETTFIA